jgi:hypothetical protein
VLIAMVADIEPAGIEAFRAYEDVVLPLLGRHGGRLERRLRTSDGTSEIHIVFFADESGYEAYLSDPDRVRARGVLGETPLEQRILAVCDVLP